MANNINELYDQHSDDPLFVQNFKSPAELETFLQDANNAKEFKQVYGPSLDETQLMGLKKKEDTSSSSSVSVGAEPMVETPPMGVQDNNPVLGAADQGIDLSGQPLPEMGYGKGLVPVKPVQPKDKAAVDYYSSEIKKFKDGIDKGSFQSLGSFQKFSSDPYFKQLKAEGYFDQDLKAINDSFNKNIYSKSKGSFDNPTTKKQLSEVGIIPTEIVDFKKASAQVIQKNKETSALISGKPPVQSDRQKLFENYLSMYQDPYKTAIEEETQNALVDSELLKDAERIIKEGKWNFDTPTPENQANSDAKGFIFENDDLIKEVNPIYIGQQVEKYVNNPISGAEIPDDLKPIVIKRLERLLLANAEEKLKVESTEQKVRQLLAAEGKTLEQLKNIPNEAIKEIESLSNQPLAEAQEFKQQATETINTELEALSSEQKLRLDQIAKDIKYKADNQMYASEEEYKQDYAQYVEDVNNANVALNTKRLELIAAAEKQFGAQNLTAQQDKKEKLQEIYTKYGITEKDGKLTFKDLQKLEGIYNKAYSEYDKDKENSRRAIQTAQFQGWRPGGTLDWFGDRLLGRTANVLTNIVESVDAAVGVENNPLSASLKYLQFVEANNRKSSVSITDSRNASDVLEASLGTIVDQVPNMALGVTAAVLTKNPYIGGSIAWAQDTQEQVGQNYRDNFRATGSESEAREAAASTLKLQTAMYPAYLLQFAPFMEGFFSTAKGITLKTVTSDIAKFAGTEYAPELITELAQNYKNAKDSRNSKYENMTFSQYALEEGPKLALEILPSVAAMTGTGMAYSRIQEQSTQKQVDAFKSALGERGMMQAVADAIDVMGEKSVFYIPEHFLMTGQITPEQFGRFRQEMSSLVSTYPQVRDTIQNDEKSKFYLDLMEQKKKVEAFAETIPDGELKDMFKAKAENIKKTMQDIINGRDVKYTVFKGQGGFMYVTDNQTASQMINKQGTYSDAISEGAVEVISSDEAVNNRVKDLQKNLATGAQQVEGISTGTNVNAATVDNTEARNKVVEESARDNAEVERLFEDAKTVESAIGNILPNVRVVVHTGTSFAEKMNSLGRPDLAKAKGFYAFDRRGGKFVSEIIINADLADDTTIAHEASHGVLLAEFGNNPETFAAMKKQLEQIVSASDNKKLNDFIKGYSEISKPEEYLVQLTAILKSEGKNLSPGILNKIALMINDIFKKLGINIVPFKNVNNTQEVVDYFNSLSASLAGGQQIERKNAVQKQTTGEVPVQPETRVGQEMVEGEPQAEPQVAPQEGQKEEVVDVSNKEQVTRLKERVSDAVKTRIIDQAEKGINTLKSVLPNFNIEVYENTDAYNTAISEIGGEVNSAGTFSYQQNEDGTFSGKILVNLDTANERTINHEITHGILLGKFGDTPEVFSNFHNQIKGVVSESDNARLNEFINQYDEASKPEEYLAELAGIMSTEGTTLSPDIITKIAKIVNQIVSTITGGTFTPFAETANKADVIDFFNQISQATQKGEAIGKTTLSDKMTGKAKVNVQETQEVKNQAQKINFDKNTGDIYVDDKKVEIPTALTNSSNSIPNALDFASASNIPTNIEFKRALQERFQNYLPKLKQAYGENFDPKKENDLLKSYLIDAYTYETMIAMKSFPDALGWYDAKTKAAMEIMSLVHPEIATDPVAAGIFKIAVAVTSNGNKVTDNFIEADRQYNYFKDNGKFDENKSIGTQSSGIKATFKLTNEILTKLTKEQFINFLTSKFRAGDLKYTGKDGKSKALLPGFTVDTEVFGASIFGPKIGNGFFMNLYGDFSQLTMDRWFMRQYGRLTGTLINVDPAKVKLGVDRLKSSLKSLGVKEKKILNDLIPNYATLTPEKLAEKIVKISSKVEKREILQANTKLDELRKAGNSLDKNSKGEIEAPKGGTQRSFIIDVFDEVQKRLKDEFNLDITIADLQAVNWYPEKALYQTFQEGKTEELGAEETSENEQPDYESAAKKLARNYGFTEKQINDKLNNEDGIRKFNTGGNQEFGRNHSDIGVELAKKQILEVKTALDKNKTQTKAQKVASKEIKTEEDFQKANDQFGTEDGQIGFKTKSQLNPKEVSTVSEQISNSVSEQQLDELKKLINNDVTVPTKTKTAYKLFKVKKGFPGELFPLFVGANQSVTTGEWIQAKAGELTQTKEGKTMVKSTLGPLAYRPGWHSGDLAVATHIGAKKNASDKAPTLRADDQVWAEVEVGDDVDWQAIANERAEISKSGEPIARTAHITDQLPLGGSYNYKTNSNMTGSWIISGEMKVNRVLTDQEVEQINKEGGGKDLPRTKPFDYEAYGFNNDGSVQNPKQVVSNQVARAYLDAKETGNNPELVSAVDSTLTGTKTKAQKTNIQTGVPVTIEYNKNPEKAPSMGKTFGQDIEPAGNYITQNEGFTPQGWQSGTVTLNNPLVIDITPQTQITYKRELSKKFGNKKGAELSNEIVKQGYDSIVTKYADGGTGEIVLLADQIKTKAQKTENYKEDVVKSKKNEDNDHTVTLNGEEVGMMYYDSSQKAWVNANFDKMSEKPYTSKWIYGDTLGDTKQEAIDELVRRYKENKPEVSQQENKVEYTKDEILNTFLNTLNNTNPLLVNPLRPREFIYNNQAALEFSRFDKGNRKEVELQDISVVEKGKGEGKAVMKDITNAADKSGITLTLEAKPFGRGGLNKKDLINFYKKNGFEVDWKNAYGGDFNSEQELIRYALKNESEGVPMKRMPQPLNPAETKVKSQKYTLEKGPLRPSYGAPAPNVKVYEGGNIVPNPRTGEIYWYYGEANKFVNEKNGQVRTKSQLVPNNIKSEYDADIAAGKTATEAMKNLLAQGYSYNQIGNEIGRGNIQDAYNTAIAEMGKEVADRYSDAQEVRLKEIEDYLGSNPVSVEQLRADLIALGYADLEIFTAMNRNLFSQAELFEAFGKNYRQTVQNAILDSRYPAQDLNEVAEDTRSIKVTQSVSDLTDNFADFTFVDANILIEHMVKTIKESGLTEAANALAEHLKGKNVDQIPQALTNFSQLTSIAGRILVMARMAKKDMSDLVIGSIERGPIRISAESKAKIKKLVQEYNLKKDVYDEAKQTFGTEKDDASFTQMLNAEAEFYDAGDNLMDVLEKFKLRYWNDVLTSFSTRALLSIATTPLSLWGNIEQGIFGQVSTPVRAAISKVKKASKKTNKLSFADYYLNQKLSIGKGISETWDIISQGKYRTPDMAEKYMDGIADVNAQTDIKDSIKFIGDMIGSQMTKMTDEEFAAAYDKLLYQTQNGDIKLANGKTYIVSSAIFRSIIGTIPEITGRMLAISGDRIAFHAYKTRTLVDYIRMVEAEVKAGKRDTELQRYIANELKGKVKNSDMDLLINLTTVLSDNSDFGREEALKRVFMSDNFATKIMGSARSGLKSKITEKYLAYLSAKTLPSKLSNVLAKNAYQGLDVITWTVSPFTRVPVNVLAAGMQNTIAPVSALMSLASYMKFKGLEADFNKKYGANKIAELKSESAQREYEKQRQELFEKRRQMTYDQSAVVTSAIVGGLILQMAISGALTPPAGADDEDRRKALNAIGVRPSEINITYYGEWLSSSPAEREKLMVTRGWKKDDLVIGYQNFGLAGQAMGYYSSNAYQFGKEKVKKSSYIQNQQPTINGVSAFFSLGESSIQNISALQTIGLALDISKAPDKQKAFEKLLGNMLAATGAVAAPNALSFFAKGKAQTQMSLGQVIPSEEVGGVASLGRVGIQAATKLSRNSQVYGRKTDYFGSGVGVFGEELKLNLTGEEVGTGAAYFSAMINPFGLRSFKQVKGGDAKAEFANNLYNTVAGMSMVSDELGLVDDKGKPLNMWSALSVNKNNTYEIGSGISKVTLSLPFDLYKKELQILGDMRYNGLKVHINNFKNNLETIRTSADNLANIEEKTRATFTTITETMKNTLDTYESEFTSLRLRGILNEMDKRGLISKEDKNKIELALPGQFVK